MRIKTQFVLTVILFGVLLCTATTMEIASSLLAETSGKNVRASDSISQDAGALYYAANDYVIYREAQQLQRWRAGFDALSRDVESLHASTPDVEAVLRGIRLSQQRLKEIFEGVAASQGDGRPVQASWSRIAVQSQALVALSSRLTGLVRARSDALQRTGIFAVLGIVAVFVGYFFVSFILIQRRTLKSIAVLQKGAAEVGGGNLDFMIDEKAQDEIGDLARAFNRMSADLKKVNRTLRMVGECNQALVRAGHEISLVKEVCRIACELGGYRMAWVGYAEHDDEKTVRPIASTGFEEGYLERTRISWADTEWGRGPTGRCIRLRAVQHCRDFLTDPDLAPWREEALKRGFRSSIALPLFSAGEAFGALTIYADAPSAFNAEQQKLLVEMADDLAFGISAIRARAGRIAALRIAEERAAQLRVLASELSRAEHTERRRLAAVLHDNLQQVLVGSKYFLATLKDEVSRGKDVAKIEEMLDEAIQVTRTMAAELSPPALYDGGLAMGLEALRREMKRKHDLEVHLCSGGDAEPRSEDVRMFLYDAVRELLFNVVKHSGVREARVELEARDNGWIRVAVSDEGKGSGSPLTAESGLGLFGIRERLGYLGGHLSVESAPGKGMRVTMIVNGGKPASEKGEGTAHTKPEPCPIAIRQIPAGSDRIRVLLVDDHQILRQGLVLLLQTQEDIEVVGEACDGKEAVKMAGDLHPDLILMDVTMPGLSGPEATRKIIAENPWIQVVALSMHERDDAAAAMRAAGAVAYLSKTAPADELIGAVRAHSRGRPRGGDSPPSPRRD